jgi:hypothetical protein
MEWQDVLQAIANDQQSPSVNDDVLQNVTGLVRYAEAQLLLPPSTVGRGYDSTTILDWDNLKTQIEVCEDHFEIYDFSKVPASIQHVAVEKPGEIPSQLRPLLGPLRR